MFYISSRVPEVLQILYRETTPYVKRRVILVLVLVIAAGLFGALGPVALKLIVDALTGQGHFPDSPFLLLGLYVMSQWLARAAGQVRGLVYGRIERRMFRTLSERLFSHLMYLPLRFHLDRRTGAVTETLTNGLEGFQIILYHLVFTVLPVIAELGTVLVVLWRLAPAQFLALFCGALIFYGGAFAYSAATVSKTARTAAAARVEASAEITDGLLNYEAVKCFAAESMVQARVARALERTETEWVTFYRKYARNGLVVASIFAIFLAATTWQAAIAVRSHQITVGDFVLINSYILQLVRPVEMLGYAMQGLSQGIAMLDTMLGLLREIPEPVTGTRMDSPRDPATLTFEHVNLSYGGGRFVLTDVSFTIPPKHTLGIVGPSGAGKSTILRLLMRLLEPDEGRILLDDVPICTLAPAHLRSAIAVVPQDALLFNHTLAYNIAFGRPQATPDEIQQASRVAHLHDFVMSLPAGYETKVGERGVKLSGGEKQRVSIARAVLKSPWIYIFDEATSSLDSRTEQEILVSLREIAKHSSTLVIAHRLSSVIHADEILVLDDGRIVERGTHSSLIEHGGAYAALWRAQHPDTATV